MHRFVMWGGGLGGGDVEDDAHILQQLPLAVDRCHRLAKVPGASYVRDLCAHGRLVTLVWVKRICRCTEPRCPQQTETSKAIRARCVLTERARREACRRVGQDGHTVATVATDFGVAGAR